jgi:hypothetical protein
LLNQDGSVQIDANGQPIDAYSQDDIEAFARCFTGWTYPPLPGATSKWPNPSYFLGQMVSNTTYHDTTDKILLNGVTVAAGGTPQADLAAALDDIFNHPNAGPFIGKQLIQQLVTSNPSPQYVQRVAAVFADDGSGVRGNLRAVVQQILLDPEARRLRRSEIRRYGKLREPALVLAQFLRGVGGYSDGEYLEQSATKLEENVFQPLSVFSYYSPTYPLQGTHLVAPPFALYDASSALARANIFNTLLGATNGIAPDASVTGATGTKLDLSSWEAAAADPATLVGDIDAVFFHGAMPDDMQSLIVSSVSAVPASDVYNRARVALYLALASAQFQTEE